MKYDTRNCFQNIVNIKGALCFCTAAAVLFLGLTVCLVTLSLTGILGSSRAPGSNGPGSPIETLVNAESLWQVPSLMPWGSVPSLHPSEQPSFLPSRKPSFPPSFSPSFQPTLHASATPSSMPSAPPSLTTVTYEPGNLSTFKRNIFLSKGLKVRRLARKNEKVVYANGETSTFTFHERPDFGATFALDDGGWIYVSNSERVEQGEGGVGALRFDKDGNILSYDMILTGTTMNCGGGRTPWGSWISCEEVVNTGQAYQVDVQGRRVPLPISMGRGRFESFSFDVRDQESPRFFLTEDHVRGAVRRFTPTDPDWDDPWTMLHGNGKLEFLVLNYKTGTFSWTSNISKGRNSAAEHYPQCEGMDVNDGMLYLVAKNIRQLFILDLDAQTYTNTTTQHGVFDGGPDQVKRILVSDDADDILYFTEEGGKLPGVHGRNSAGQFFTILEGDYNDETTGLSFSPGGMFMYVAFQERGLLFELSREDGLPFHGRTLNINYHNQAAPSGRKI